MTRAFDRYLTFLKKLHDRVISNQYDRVIPVIGDEGVGKSTLMIQTAIAWQHIKGETPTTESVLDCVVWDDTEEFLDHLSTRPKRSVIAVMDAARVLNRKEAMRPDQIEAEKALFDARRREHLVLLGFQSPQTVPTDMADRRAKNAVRIPDRGVLHGFSRDTLNNWDWQKPFPDPDMTDRFRSLDGTDIWEAFNEADENHKAERISETFGGDEEDEADDEATPQQLAEEIAEAGIEEYVSINSTNKMPYIDASLIYAKHDVTHRDSKTVKKLLEQEFTLSRSDGDSVQVAKA